MVLQNKEDSVVTATELLSLIGESERMLLDRQHDDVLTRTLAFFLFFPSIFFG